MKLGSIFTDGAVLQRGISIPIWGETAPDCYLDCELNGCKVRGASGADGHFMIRMPAQTAGGPYHLTVTNVKTGESVRVSDLLIGEVWIASGQSNMEHLMVTSEEQMREYAANNPCADQVRMIKVPHSALTMEQTTFEAKWMKSTKEQIEDPTFSAVGLWFARRIWETLQVPVGIINSSWGGTIVEAWTSRSMLRQNPELSGYLDILDQNLCDSKVWENIDLKSKVAPSVDMQKFFRENCVADSDNLGEKKGWADTEFHDGSWPKMTVPGDWVCQELGGHGSFWIRKSVDLPASWAGKDLEFHFCGIDKMDTTYCNGVEIGKSGVGFAADVWDVKRNYLIPASLVESGRAVFAIRAYSFVFGAGFYGSANDCYVCPVGGGKSDRISIAGEWKAHQETRVATPPNSTSSVSSQVPGNANTYSNLFNGMIRPLIPYAVKGAIWYQGESNAGPGQESAAYRRKMVDLIRDWRYQWGQRDFAFLQVSLAGFQGEMEYDSHSTWAVLRQCQDLASKELPDSYLACAYDCGESDNIHPKDKRTVGDRLARQALYHVYGRNEIVPCGPVLSSVRKEGSTLRLLFDWADGLHAKGTDGVLTGFYLGNSSRVFVKADAVIDGTTVVLHSAEVENPAYVRYAWSDHPIANLYNGAGLPAFPFEA